MKTLVLQLFGENIFKNAFYPIASTGTMAVLGFVFWIVVARNFSTGEVGVATTLISIMSMVSVLGLIGFDTATIRFLANTKNKNVFLNTAFFVIGIASMVLALSFVVLSPIFSPTLAFLRHDIALATFFIVFCVFSTLNIFTDAVFLALRATNYTFIINTIFSAVKIVLPSLFIPWGAFGIFVAVGIAQTLGFAMSMWVLKKYFSYHPLIMLSLRVLKKTWRYSAGNYLADVFNFLPATILPIMVLNNLGAEVSAYYYVVMMVVGFLYVIPTSVTRSFFAEESFHRTITTTDIKKTIRYTALFLIPAMFILFIGGKTLLKVFGAEYGQHSVTFLYIMTLSAVGMAPYTIYGALFRISANISALIMRNAVYTSSVVLLSIPLFTYGLTGVGIAHIAGICFAVLISAILYKRSTTPHMPPQ